MLPACLALSSPPLGVDSLTIPWPEECSVSAEQESVRLQWARLGGTLLVDTLGAMQHLLDRLMSLRQSAEQQKHVVGNLRLDLCALFSEDSRLQAPALLALLKTPRAQTLLRAHVQRVDLRSARELRDVGPFAVVPELLLDSARHLRHLAALDRPGQQLRRLSLRHMRLVDDEAVAALAPLRLDMLDISGCYLVTDISPLQNVAVLRASCCYAVRHVPRLESVEELVLCGLDQLHDVRELGTSPRLRKLALTFSKVQDVAPLAAIPHLDLSFNNHLADVSMLGLEGSYRDLSCCPLVMDVSALGRVHTLKLAFCLVRDVAALANVHCLDLSGARNITNVAVLATGRIHTLVLTRIRIPSKLLSEADLWALEQAVPNLIK